MFDFETWKSNQLIWIIHLFAGHLRGRAALHGECTIRAESNSKLYIFPKIKKINVSCFFSKNANVLTVIIHGFPIHKPIEDRIIFQWNINDVLMESISSLLVTSVEFANCEAQEKGRAKGQPRKVTQRSFIDGGWWISFPWCFTLNLVATCNHHHPPTCKFDFT